MGNFKLADRSVDFFTRGVFSNSYRTKLPKWMQYRVAEVSYLPDTIRCEKKTCKLHKTGERLAS
jgi:hypothetical protein